MIKIDLSGGVLPWDIKTGFSTKFQDENNRCLSRLKVVLFYVTHFEEDAKAPDGMPAETERKA